MEVELRKSDTELIGITDTQHFSIPISGKLMEILSDLYIDSRVAIVRELSSNMMDAVRTVPDAPKGIITLPTIISPEIVFQDFGIGMSHDTVVNIFTVYTTSTKDQDNTNTGGWGLGGKSPFAYTTTWTLECVHDGIRSQYLLFKDEEGMSTCSRIQEVETQERNGVKITLPVLEDDMDMFMAAALYFCPFLPHAIKVVDHPLGDDLLEPIEFSHISINPQGYGWSIPIYESHPTTPRGWKPRESEFQRKYYQYEDTATLVLADVPYAIRENANKNALADLGEELKFLAKLPIFLYMPAGSLNVVPSRDSIQNTTRSREQIKNAFEKILKEVRKHVQESTDLCETAEELYMLLKTNYIAKKTLGDKDIERQFTTIGMAEIYDDRDHALWGEEYQIPSTSYDPNTSTRVRINLPAHAIVKDNYISVLLPKIFLSTYRITPFHSNSKYNRKHDWISDPILPLHKGKPGTLFTYKPEQDLIYYDDIITMSTERVRQSTATTIRNKKANTCYLFKRLDKEPIKEKEAKYLAQVLSMPNARLLAISDLDEPVKEASSRVAQVVKVHNLDEELQAWVNIRVISVIHAKDYTDMGYGFFNPKTPEELNESSYQPVDRDPKAGGYYLPVVAFRIQNNIWPIKNNTALDLAMTAKKLVHASNLPWSYTGHREGLIVIPKSFTLDIEKLPEWKPALPILMKHILLNAFLYNPAASLMNSRLNNTSLKDISTALLDTKGTQGIRLPNTLRRLQVLARLAKKGAKSDAYAKNSYDFLKQYNKEPIDEEILEARLIKAREFLDKITQDAPELFTPQYLDSSTILATKIAALVPEEVLNSRRIT
ncbi:hypothetical protein LCGC14_0820070 [marine sediment metagenome]|uniref:Histidine kinase/HSP90-like ATPase domain-containing protein n=1 Tax=marine sediment metagenome TaxID=412755 RepID=A0A0F9Q4D4_9ZZZZ